MIHIISFVYNFFIIIRSNFEFNLFLKKKKLNTLIILIQSVTWFEVLFSSEKIYKNIIICRKKNNSHYEPTFIDKFGVLIGSLFEFQIIFKKFLNLLINPMHYVLFNFNFICIVKKKLKNMVICIRVTIESF